jgi:integrase
VCQWVSKAVACRLSRSTFGILTLLDEQMSRAFVQSVANKSAMVTLLHFLRRYAKTPILAYDFFRILWSPQYTDRGVRKMLARYAGRAGIEHSMSPHKWRHFLFTWLKKEGIDDALIQPYSGHVTRQSLEIYSKLSLADAQFSYNQAMEHFPIQ